ncbi:MAG: hypothetical protein ACI87E_003408 [Mariniblastus sp.]|jgi:hypothetical protein
MSTTNTCYNDFKRGVRTCKEFKMQTPFLFSLVWLVGVLTMVSSADAIVQRKGINQDESKVPEFELPRVLACQDGEVVKSVEAWEKRRRPELLQLFCDHVYGNVPEKTVPVSFSVGDQWEVLDGAAMRKEVVIRFGEGDSAVEATMLLTTPTASERSPCFLGFNFNGNHTTTSDPNVTIPASWVRNKKSFGTQDNKAGEQGRGKSASRWPCREIVGRGFAVATIYYGDVDPDLNDFSNGVHPLFYAEGQISPSEKQWGSIGAWAWALSRALDYLEKDSSINASRVAVIGHSRLGKTSLWAGARDSRFWMTVSNDSGCGGAALHRRKFGETVKVINTSFPHWFCDQFVQYNDNENLIPVDQHQLMSLIAPRLIYVASASQDLWADPRGEYLSLAESDETFGLYEGSGFESMARDIIQPDQPVRVGCRAYHVRSGAHDITLYDWGQYMEFAGRHLKSR